MSRIIKFIKRIFGYTIIIDVEKYKIGYGKFDDTSIKEIEKMYKNTISELYLHGHTDAAKIVGKQLSHNFIEYKKHQNIKKQ